MSAEAYRRARELFEQARDLGPDEQRRLLDSEAGDDPALRDEVASLLASHARVGTFLVTPLVEQRAAARPHPDPDAGEEETGPALGTIGQYRLLERIGAGGSGVVYRAVQEGLRRPVALKVLRRAAVSASSVERFERETLLLARLQHPGIAQIHDAGAVETAEGRLPYLAMELVLGSPIDAFVRDAAYDIDERLSLLARVCDAVQHAHEQGVLHRDLKPANILVTRTGQPKVLDFGVARALDESLDADGLMTGTGQLVGTLPYMSPEQLDGDSRSLDARSDVFALGVLAYELLTGRVPHDPHETDPLETARRIRHEEAVPLGRVDPRLRGDLEVIAGKALAKERAQRYASAAELREDLRRYLADEPILSRPPSRTYYLRKFTRRHRGLVGAAAAIALSLVIGAAVSFHQARRAERHADRSAAASLALLELITSREHGWTDPGQAARVRLDGAIERVLETLGDDPLLASQACFRAGLYHDSLGDHERALAAYERARAILVEAGADPAILPAIDIEIAVQLASTRGIDAALERGRAAMAHPLPAGPPWLAMSQEGRAKLAMLLLGAGRPREAEPVLTELLEMEGPAALAPLLRGQVKQLLSSCTASRGHLLDAERLLEEAIDDFELAAGPDSSEAQTAKAALASLFAQTGRAARGLPLQREARDALVRSFGWDHSLSALAELQLVLISLDAGAAQEGLEVLDRFLHRARTGSIRGTRQIADSLELIHVELGRLGEPGLSLELARWSALELERSLAHDPVRVLRAHGRLRDCLASAGEWDEALADYRGLLERGEAALPAVHPMLARLRLLIGGLLLDEQRYAEAEELLVRAYTLLLENAGEHDLHTQMALERVRQIALEYEDADEALAILAD